MLTANALAKVEGLDGRVLQPLGLTGPNDVIVPANTVDWVRLSTANMGNATGRYRAAWLMIDLTPKSERVVRRVRVIFHLLVFQIRGLDAVCSSINVRRWCRHARRTSP